MGGVIARPLFKRRSRPFAVPPAKRKRERREKKACPKESNIARVRRLIDLGMGEKKIPKKIYLRHLYIL
jgi:hypothetical protein